ncbi:MAG: aminotransferase class I/II-fold pyridoxal phosphate-dependent enzyme, partial [Clostridia bacterium]|nr:aminotransferase class I/II-fold pyridoxal phosphate-dependent enzyme [Clostridia bacterium]
SFGTMLRYKHNDMEDLEKCLQKVPDRSGALIITDGVFSMGGDIANLPEIVRLAKQYGARVMVDDAHGLGVLGDGGRGTANYFGLEDDVDIYMGTFSKSLASLGGYMATTHAVADYVRHASRPFIFSASIPPSSCAVALASLRYLKAHPEIVTRLSELSAYAREGLTRRGLRVRASIAPGGNVRPASTPIVPIYTYDTINTLEKAKAMYEAGVYVNPVLPPATPPSECLLRTSYMATHTEALLDEAMDIIASVMEAQG